MTVAGETVSGTHPAIGMVFQEESTFPWRTVLENVAFPLEIAGVGEGASGCERAAHFVATGRPARASSAAIRPSSPAACASASRSPARSPRKPRILLMDEPFAALDEQTRLLLGDKVLQIQQELKQTTLLITHNLTEAVQLSDRVLVMTYRPGPAEARRRHRPAASARLRGRVSSDAFGHYVAEIWHDLREEASRGIQDDESRVLQRGAPRDDAQGVAATSRAGARLVRRRRDARRDRASSSC